MFKVSSAAVGNNTVLQFSNYSYRLLFVKNHSLALIYPQVHRNIINLYGVSHKNDYLIWREKGGFFTAMDRRGLVQTWSLATGHLLYNLTDTIYSKLDQHQLAKFEEYDVYYAAKEDESYHRDNFNSEDFSVSLIVARKPLMELIHSQYSKFYQELARTRYNVETHLSHDNKLITVQ